jgi:hypothetical protein
MQRNPTVATSHAQRIHIQDAVILDGTVLELEMLIQTDCNRVDGWMEHFAGEFERDIRFKCWNCRFIWCRACKD